MNYQQKNNMKYKAMKLFALYVPTTSYLVPLLAYGYTGDSTLFLDVSLEGRQSAVRDVEMASLWSR